MLPLALIFTRLFFSPPFRARRLMLFAGKLTVSVQIKFCQTLFMSFMSRGLFGFLSLIHI